LYKSGVEAVILRSVGEGDECASNAIYFRV
jgi:hypothetical protein